MVYFFPRFKKDKWHPWKKEYEWSWKSRWKPYIFSSLKNIRTRTRTRTDTFTGIRKKLVRLL